MATPKHTALVAGAVAFGLIIGVSNIAVAQTKGDVVGELADNEGYFVDGTTFKIAKGKAKSDPTPDMLQKLGAREIGQGVTVFRANGKLYMIQGAAQLPPQAMKSFQDQWTSNMKDFQDNWKSNMKDEKSTETYKAAMKEFQDQWANSYMKDFQDQWKSNMTMKDFQDQWVNNMKNFQDQWKSNMKDDAQVAAMKDFQDQWTNFMKNFQDQWKSNMTDAAALKAFQDNWATSYAR